MQIKIQTIQTFNTHAIIYFSRGQFLKYLNDPTPDSHKEPEVVDWINNFMEATKRYDSNFHPVTIKVYDSIRKLFSDHMSSYNIGDTYMPSIIGAECLNSWFSHDKSYVCLPEQLNGLDLSFILDRAIDIHGWDMEVKKASRFADKIVDKLINNKK